jgi:hypothetical protein
MGRILVQDLETHSAPHGRWTRRNPQEPVVWLTVWPFAIVAALAVLFAASPRPDHPSCDSGSTTSWTIPARCGAAASDL